MAIMNSCNKHNMIACVEKTERNADFHDVIDFLTGCSVNYALLVSPDVIQQWIQQFWNTAKVRMINEVAHIAAKVAGKYCSALKVLLGITSTDNVVQLSISTSEVMKNMVYNLKNQGEEVISVIPLAVKSPIVSWKSYCKGDAGYYEIHRADGSYKTYIFFSEMLNDFDREDLIVLYRLLNKKYASTRPSFNDLMLWGDLKIMFEPDSDDEVWKNHQNQELIEWKLYDSCRVHSLMLGEVSIHMLVEKKYPLPQDTLTRMLQWKLHVNNDVTEMAF
ncbi:hypothetical protein Tco_1329893 [Tanacetum coccineum]